MADRLVTVDARSRVWLRSDPSVELIPSVKAWRHARRGVYWYCRRGRAVLGPWKMTTALAIAAAGLSPRGEGSKDR